MLFVGGKIEEIKEEKYVTEITITNRKTATSEGFSNESDVLGTIAKSEDKIIIIGRARSNSKLPISAMILSTRIISHQFIEYTQIPIFVMNRVNFRNQSELDDFLSIMLAEFIDKDAKLYLYGEVGDSDDEYFE